MNSPSFFAALGQREHYAACGDIPRPPRHLKHVPWSGREYVREGVHPVDRLVKAEGAGYSARIEDHVKLDPVRFDVAQLVGRPGVACPDPDAREPGFDVGCRCVHVALAPRHPILSLVADIGDHHEFRRGGRGLDECSLQYRLCDVDAANAGRQRRGWEHDILLPQLRLALRLAP